MADGSANDGTLAPLIEEDSEDSEEEEYNKKKKKEKPVKKQGLVSRIFNGIFRIGNRGGDDFEKRLQHIYREEASVLARMKSRSRAWRRIARNLIVFSVFLEVIAVGYAIMTTRSIDLDWKMRALRVLPMFLLPGLSSAIYFTLINFIKMCDGKDQKTLERLRDERQAKINELKERTNYYTTQQLIQRYDPDPAAKAAAASVLASKLGADSGFKVYLGEESMLNNTSLGKSYDNEYVQSKGLRNRKQSHSRSNSTPDIGMPHFMEEAPPDIGFADSESPSNQSVIVDHHPRSTAFDNGWFARIAALLVGEDPTQSYALICGNCHMHNGLARKEDFPYITYYCPHCHALNKSRELEEPAHVSSMEEHPPVSSSSGTSISGSPTNLDIASSLTENKLLSANLSPVAETMPSEEDKVSE